MSHYYSFNEMVGDIIYHKCLERLENKRNVPGEGRLYLLERQGRVKMVILFIDLTGQQTVQKVSCNKTACIKQNNIKQQFSSN